MVSSLNATLARLSAIESNFNALEVFSNRINQNYAMQNYNAVESKKDNFATVLDAKEKIERKSEELIEQASDAAQSSIAKSVEEKGHIAVLKEKLQATAPMVALKEKLDEIAPIETLKGKIEQIAPIETLKEKIIHNKPKNVDEIISSVSKKYNVDENFIRAIIKQESGFNPNATSKKGAMGLMQLMPKTAKGLGVADAYNPTQNVDGGVRYIKSLMDKYDGDMKVALAAYNAGPTAVNRYGGIPPYKETQNYVNKVMAIYEKSNEVNLWLQKE